MKILPPTADTAGGPVLLAHRPPGRGTRLFRPTQWP
jgi:hypothetical protein